MYQPYMVAMSHLSDAQELMSMGMTERANRNINFAKYIIGKCREDMMDENFDPNTLWKEFVEQGF